MTGSAAASLRLRWRGDPAAAAAWIGLASIFVVDLRLEASYVVALLYVPALLVGLVSRQARLSLHLSAAATLLVALDWIGTSTGAHWGVAVFNRILVVAMIWITAIGVTMYRRAADRRRESLRAFTDMKEALDQSAIVAVTDVPGRIKFVNDKFCEISRYPREELIGQDHRLLNSRFHSKEFVRDLWRTIAQGRVWRGELRNRAKDGSLYWVDTTIVPFLDASGKPWQYMAIRYDITERKAQEQRLRDQTALAALGEFAAVVAHEVRNPLAGIRNGVQLIASELPSDAEGALLSHDIVARIDSLNTVIEDLLTFARPRPFAPSPVAVQPLISELVSAFKQDPAMHGIEVEITGGADVVIDADPNQLRLVFMNLLVNAAQAMHGVGRIDVAIERERDEACAISVADRGTGVTAEVLPRVFEPFFTTKHRGTGLGLPTVKRVVEAHHGQVTLDNRPGGGTVVRVVLPRRPPAAPLA